MQFSSIQGSGSAFNPAPSGGGGKYSSNQVADNTLRSNAFARIVELISEGPIEGLVQGGVSIYFNQTPVVNANNTVNFRGVMWEQRDGLPDQTPMLGNATSSLQTSVGLQIKYSVSPPVVTIEDVNATSAKVIVSVPSLYSTDDQGNVNPASVSWQVQVQSVNSGAWHIVDTVNLFNQKCMSVYQHQSAFPLPAGGSPWSIRVVRLTNDSNTTNLSNDIYFDSYTEIVAGNFVYPNSAVVGMTIDAALFQSGSIPARSFHVKGLIIQVPSNYDPVARTYTGVWDGTFKTAYSNNPAWVFYDLLTNNRYGIGDFIDPTKVDKWGLYTIARYCDGSVPNGYGGQEPRYVFNGVLNNRQEAWKALQSITSTFRGMTYWSTGQVFAVADMPRDPVKLVTPANVIDGHFQYSGTALKARHSVAMVRWNDPQGFYVPTVEVVVDNDQLLKFGWRETNITAVGCTSRGQANRMGRWLLDTEKFATETVEYVCAWDHVDVRPGDVIAIADPNKSGVRLGGRIAVATNTTHVTLDQPFTPKDGATYSLMVELPDGSVSTRPVSSFGLDYKTVALSSALSALPLVGAMFVITGSDVEPRQYSVTNISESDKHTYKVTAVFYDPTKYARVEQAIPLAPLPYSRPKSTINPPANFVINESVYMANGAGHNRLTLSWSPSDDFMASGYLISARAPNGGGVTTLGQTTASTYEINDPAIGAWTFYIQSIGIDGRQSTYISADFNVQGWVMMPPPYVSHLEIFGQGADTDFTGRDVHITWENNFPGSTTDVGQESAVGAGAHNPFFRSNVLSVVDINSGVTLRQEILYATDYVYTYEKNLADNSPYGRGAQRTFRFELAVQDTLGRISVVDPLVVSNPAPDLMLPQVSSASGNIYVSWVNNPGSDYVGNLVWISTNPNFDPYATTPAYQGGNNFFVYPGVIGTTYYVRIAGYDVFGTSGLNISPPVQIECAGYQPDTAPPAVPTGLALASGITTMPTGEVVQTLSAAWDASPSDNIAYFEVAIEQLGGNYITTQTSANGYVWSSGLIAGQTYLVRVRAWSQVGYPSAWCTPVQIVMAAKTTAPNAPTGLTATASLKAAYLAWTLPADTDIDHIEIWQSLDTVLAHASAIGSSYGAGYTVSGLTTGQAYSYWIRAVNTSGIASAYLGPATVTPASAVNGDLAANSITVDKIVAGTITGDRLDIHTNLPATITLGATGVAIGSLADPAQFINANSTLIGPGKIQLVGSTTLAAWQSGGDATKINGGSISANSIAANSLQIGNRGVAFTGFSFGYATGSLSWSAGVIAYISDAGTPTSLSIASGSGSWSSGTLYVYWTKDSGAFFTSTTLLSTANTINVASYSAATGLLVTYGGSTIDGSNIAAGSILTNALGAASITADKIAAGAITADKITAGSITADKITGGTITADKIAVGGVGASNLASNAALGNIGAGGITSTYIGNGAIATAQLAANAITADKIAAGAITASSLGVTTLSAITANMGTITAGQMNSSVLASDGVTPILQIDLNNGFILFSK